MAAFLFDARAALSEIQEETPATTATEAATKPEMSQLSQLSQRRESENRAGRAAGFGDDGPATIATTATLPAVDAFEERAAIAEHDGELPRAEAEALAAQEQDFDSADDLHHEAVEHWRREIDRLAGFGAVSRNGAEALRRAQTFIREKWALQAVRLGWNEVELFGVCPRAPWARLDRKGAAFGGAVQAVTAEAVVYVGGLRRYRAMVNNDGGAVPIWELSKGTDA